MIPIVYPANEQRSTIGNTFGLCTLSGTTSCIVEEERNGSYNLTLQILPSEIEEESLQVERIIAAQVNDDGDVDYFRIKSITKDIDGLMTISATHLSFDLLDYIKEPFTVNDTITNVLSAICANTGFVASYPVEHGAVEPTIEFATTFPYPVRHLLLGAEGSVLDAIGGEFLFRGFDVTLMASRGEDKGITVKYGKNMTALDYTTSSEGKYNRVLPYAVYYDANNEEQVVIGNAYEYDGPIEPGGDKTTYYRKATLLVDFSSEFEDTIPTVAALTQLAEDYARVNPLRDIIPEINTSFVPLWYSDYTKENADYQILERVKLCDTVTVHHPKLNLDIKAKVVKTRYDVLLEQYTNIEIGMWRTSFADTYAAMSEQTEATLTAISRYPSRWKADVAEAIDPLAPKNSPQFTGTVRVGNATSNGSVEIRQASASANDPYNLKFKSASSRYMAQHGTQYSRMYDSNVSGEAPAASGGVNNTTRSANGYYASDNTSFSAATKGSAMTREDGFITKDGDEVVTHNANGFSWEHGTGGASSLRIFTLTHTSTVTAETTYTIDLPYGTYLFLHSRQTTAGAASTGMQLVIIGQSVGSSAIIKTTAESGAQIGATSGTRSQVDISNTRQGSTSDSTDRIATVTWTIQGLSYRRLVMVRLM